MSMKRRGEEPERGGGDAGGERGAKRGRQNDAEDERVHELLLALQEGNQRRASGPLGRERGSTGAGGPAAPTADAKPPPTVAPKANLDKVSPFLRRLGDIRTSSVCALAAQVQVLVVLMRVTTVRQARAPLPYVPKAAAANKMSTEKGSDANQHAFDYEESLKAAQTLSGLAHMEAQKLAAEKKERKNFTKETVDELKKWFANHLDHPYPDEEDKEELARKTNLNVSQVCIFP